MESIQKKITRSLNLTPHCHSHLSTLSPTFRTQSPIHKFLQSLRSSQGANFSSQYQIPVVEQGHSNRLRFVSTAKGNKHTNTKRIIREKKKSMLKSATLFSPVYPSYLVHSYIQTHGTAGSFRLQSNSGLDSTTVSEWYWKIEAPHCGQKLHPDGHYSRCSCHEMHKTNSDRLLSHDARPCMWATVCTTENQKVPQNVDQNTSRQWLRGRGSRLDRSIPLVRSGRLWPRPRTQ